MSNIHKITSNGQEYTLNFNSYAVMQVYKKYGTDGLATVQEQQPFEFMFDMIKFGLSDNGRKALEDSDVYEFIDGIGGVTSETFLQDIGGWIREAFQVPEAKKKAEMAV